MVSLRFPGLELPSSPLLLTFDLPGVFDAVALKKLFVVFLSVVAHDMAFSLIGWKFSSVKDGEPNES